MKKGIIAISLLLTGALLITPITNAISQKDVAKDVKPVKIEQVASNEKIQVTNDNTNKTTQTEEQPTDVETKYTVSQNIVDKTTDKIDKTNVNEDSNNKKEKAKVEITKPSAEEVNKVQQIKVESTTLSTVQANKDEQTKVEVTKPSNEITAQENKDQEVSIGMTKLEAQEILNKYIKDVEQADLSYTYQGDENNFKAIKDKGMRGYVFLPNVDTDLAYLVDKDTGNIYYFHPSGYFELLQ